ncbi:hypothetical protein CLOBY_06570 [Clostridium saccharobutylicum]|uniref:hypothetical protein n=1 Tax=Clostridium saccharobutylicum TaxID=169679 RepID=UPI000983F656|nr:hypothetical protein [Clostridium saccharobutylicum]AQS08547.1 hypothetical protein CLOBY_06570 [Clostridium saccharobutylicum]NSB87792.1 hypothetical protein [Clostridium saccharobutylicum]NYC29114.1 hypothetical protein [Clostridium saccharobutylicum]OOM13251.1 hypothetical protein CLSAB_34530 [Clostridium saccharobutylicum]
MNNYRSAYENYYKNINNRAKGKQDSIRYSPLGKKRDDLIKSPYGISKSSEFNFKQFFVKRIMRELIGAAILLLLFVGLKYIPANQVSQVHNTCKEVLNQQVNYDESIDAFNNVEVGNFKMKDLRIGDFTLEDFKSNNLKVRTSNFIEYLKNRSNSQVKPEDELSIIIQLQAYEENK